jgi:succinate dehydrogenase / fumarate reductase cytochrome b subunit
MGSNPVFKYLGSSIGRKQISGLTGIFLYLFLLVHLAGNLGMLAGAEDFNRYSYLLLHTLREVILPIECALLLAFVLHLVLGLKLAVENSGARSQGYAVNASKAKRGFYSRYMAFSGTWLLIFVLVHVPHFRLGAYGSIGTVIYNGIEMRDIYGTAMHFFAKPWFTLFYVFSFAILFTHLAHGVQSSFQSLGINHARYNAAIRWVSKAYAILICGGFAGLAVWAYFQRGA